MSILSFDKPEKLRSTERHNEDYQSDSGIDGTYMPNMSEVDKAKWKAKLVKGADLRVEVRKTLQGRDATGAYYAQILLVVRASEVVMSANGRMVFSTRDWHDLQHAVVEAAELLREAV